jgi:hypothetical protein
MGATTLLMGGNYRRFKTGYGIKRNLIIFMWGETFVVRATARSEAAVRHLEVIPQVVAENGSRADHHA